MDTQDLITILLAIYGALVSTILAVREIRKEQRRVRVRLDYLAAFERGQITVVNVGQRPVTIQNIALEVYVAHPDGSAGWERVRSEALYAYDGLAEGEAPPEPPVRLEDGEVATFTLSEYASTRLRDTLYVGHSPKLTVTDAEGSVFRGEMKAAPLVRR